MGREPVERTMTVFQWHGGQHRKPGIRKDQQVSREEAERRVLAVLERVRGTRAAQVAG